MGLKQKFPQLEIDILVPSKVSETEIELALVSEELLIQPEFQQVIQAKQACNLELICITNQPPSFSRLLQLISFGCRAIILEKQIETQLPIAISAAASDGCYFDRSFLIGDKVSQTVAILSNLERLEAVESCLSKRERQIFDLYLSGFNHDEIGGKLGIVKSTVGGHLRSIREKLDLPSNRDIIKFGITS